MKHYNELDPAGTPKRVCYRIRSNDSVRKHLKPGSKVIFSDTSPSVDGYWNKKQYRWYEGVVVTSYSLAVKVDIGVKMSFIFAVLMVAKSSSVR